MKTEKWAIYPGSFDPITNGHIDIINRGQRIFERIIVAVLKNPAKQTLFSLEERLELIRTVFKDNERVEVDHFDGLLIDFARKRQIKIIVRGLRAISDFDIELQMALLNRKISPQIETIFFMPSIQFSYLSSRLVKEVYSLGGELTSLVPAHVDLALKSKFRSQ